MHGRPPLLRVIATTALVVVLAGCSSDEPEAVPEPTPAVTAAEPTPSPPDTVALSHEVHVQSVDDDDVMTKQTPRTPLDEAAITDTAERLVDLLRAHLDDLNAGRDGLLAGLTAPGLLIEDPEIAGLLRTDLADPTNFATEADVAVRLGADGAPKWAEADLDVLRIDGTRARLALVFVVGDDAFELVLVGLPDEVAA